MILEVAEISRSVNFTNYVSSLIKDQQKIEIVLEAYDKFKNRLSGVEFPLVELAKMQIDLEDNKESEDVLFNQCVSLALILVTREYLSEELKSLLYNITKPKETIKNMDQF